MAVGVCSQLARRNLGGPVNGEENLAVSLGEQPEVVLEEAGEDGVHVQVLVGQGRQRPVFLEQSRAQHLQQQRVVVGGLRDGGHGGRVRADLLLRRLLRLKDQLHCGARAQAAQGVRHVEPGQEGRGRPIAADIVHPVNLPRGGHHHAQARTRGQLLMELLHGLRRAARDIDEHFCLVAQQEQLTTRLHRAPPRLRQEDRRIL